MLTVLISGFFGLLGAAVPELFRFFRDREDKKHEITMLRLQSEHTTVMQEYKLEAIGIQNESREMQALYRTTKVNIKWVDSLSATVRPALAYGFFTLYAGLKIMTLLSLPESTPIFIYQALWTDDDRAAMAAILGFYFGSREFQKHRQRMGR